MAYNSSDFQALFEKWQKVEAQLPRFLEDFLIRQGLDAIRKTKENTPVVTGLLRNSWSLSSVIRKGDDLMVEISNNVQYAASVEYGHRQEPGRYVPALKKSLKASFVPGRFMATLALKDVRSKMPNRFKKEFRQWLSTL